MKTSISESLHSLTPSTEGSSEWLQSRLLCVPAASVQFRPGPLISVSAVKSPFQIRPDVSMAAPPTDKLTDTVWTLHPALSGFVLCGGEGIAVVLSVQQHILAPGPEDVS